MGLFGALFTGVSALAAQSQSVAIISNNIANVNTTGFKRAEASFFSLVTTTSSSSRFSPGTVTVNRIQEVDQQGTISQSSSGTDAAISGNGFFTIKRDSDDSALTEFLYTRNGQFSENAQGLLVNSAGFFLYGYPLDSLGNLPANQGDLDSLVPIDVAFLGGLTRPTTTAQLSINLDARESFEQLSAANTAANDFSRTITVFDSLGTPQNVTFAFVKTYGPSGTAVSSLTGLSATDNLISDLNLTDAHEFRLTDDGGNLLRLEVDNGGGVADANNTAVQTVGDLIDAINASSVEAIAFLGNDGELVVQRTEFIAGTESLTLDDTTIEPAGTLASSAWSDLGFSVTGATAANGGNLTVTSDNLASPSVYAAGNGTAASLYSNGQFPQFTSLPGDTNYNERGWWQVKVTDPNNNNLALGLVNFNSDGTLNATTDTDGNIDIEIQNIDWGNGSDVTQDIEVDISAFTQFASDFNVLFTDQDGAELGLRTGVEISREGLVVAQFSNGATSNLYQLPLATFSNPNGLTEQSGTAYTESESSGEENLRIAGSGGAGFFEPSTLENSNVDLADEFALLIVAQRAYSAGTKVINTIDQMTQELLQLR